MKSVAFIGLDFSLASPGLTFECRNELSCYSTFSSKDLTTITLSKAFQKSTHIGCLVDPSAIKPDKFPSQESREIFLANSICYMIRRQVNMYCVDELHIAIEGYSFGSKFSQAHKIGEATGCVIAVLANMDCPTLKTENIKIYRPSPQEVKKSVGGKIKDGKEGVYQKFVEATEIDLMSILDKKTLKSPISDLCDSWACYRWLKQKLDK